MGKNMKVAIVVGLQNRASAGLQAIGGQVKSMSAGMTQSLGGPGRALDGLGGIATAIAPELALPLGALNFGAKAAMMGLKTLGSIGMGALRGIATVSGVAVTAVRGLVGVIGNGVSRLREMHKWILLVGAGASAMLLKSSIQAAADMEGYLAKLTTALKSTAAAQKMLDWAKAFAAKTPFAVDEVVDASVRLEMYGLGARKWLPLVGDLAGSMGKRVTDAVEAIADAVSGGGMERLKEFAITSTRLKGAGWTGSYQTAEGIKTLTMALEKLITENYGGGMDRLSKTAVGAMSNFRDQINQLKVEIGQGFMPAFRRMLSFGSKVLEGFSKVGGGQALGRWFGSIAEQVLVLAARALPTLISSFESFGRTARFVLGAVGRAARALPTLISSFASFGRTVCFVLGAVGRSEALQRLGASLTALFTVMRLSFGSLANAANPAEMVVGVITGIIDKVAAAVNWLTLNVFAPQKLAAIAGWFAGMGRVVANLFKPENAARAVAFAEVVIGGVQALVRFMAANIPVACAWLKYFADWLSFAAKWARKHLPDMLLVTVNVVCGIAKAFLFLGQAANGLKAIWDVVIGSLATVILGVASGVVAALNSMMVGITMAVKAMNVLSGGAFDGWVKGLEDANRSADTLLKNLLGATGDQAMKIGVSVNAALDRSMQMQVQRDAIDVMQADATKWAEGFRVPGPEPVAPVAPQTQFVSWQEGSNRPAVTGKLEIDVNVTGGDAQSIQALLENPLLERRVKEQIRRMVPAKALQ